jgi:peptide deformylase
MVPVPDPIDHDIRSEIASLGIRQGDDPILRAKTRHVALPGEANIARQVLSSLFATTEKLRSMHPFQNGVGLAAPQIGHSTSVALVRPIDHLPVRLLNPRIIECSSETSTQYEGCLSFFDYRGLVSRPRWIIVENSDLLGRSSICKYTGSLARLVAHEIDHLNGILYVDFVQDQRAIVDIANYRSQSWQ